LTVRGAGCFFFSLNRPASHTLLTSLSTHHILLLLFPLSFCLVPMSHIRFEGVTRQDIPHGMGVMVFGNGTGGGFHFRDVRVGDT